MARRWSRAVRPGDLHSECRLGRVAQANFLALRQRLIHDHEIAIVLGSQPLVCVQHFDTVYSPVRSDMPWAWASTIEHVAQRAVGRLGRLR